MSEISRTFIWFVDAVFSTATLLIAVLAFYKIRKLRNDNPYQLIYLFLYWFSGAFLVLISIYCFNHAILQFLFLFEDSDSIKKIISIATVIYHLAFIFVAAVALTFTYLKEQAEEQERQAEYSGKLAETNQLVLRLAHQVDENIENLPRFENPALVKCWEVMNCQQSGCELYGKDAARCWQRQAVLSCVGKGCDGADSEVVDVNDCQNCRVFTAAGHDLLSTTGEVLNNMFFILEQNQKKVKRENKNYLEVLGFVSHELKTPLVTLSGYVSLLDRNSLGELNEGQKKAVEVMRRGINNLQEMVTNYLDLTRLEHKEIKPDFRRLDLMNDIVWPVLVSFREVISSNGIKVEIINESQGVTLEADSVLLNIVFNNLIGNAIKYGEKNGKIILTVEDDQGMYKIRVRNDGGNIPLEMREKIFCKFTRMNTQKQASEVKGTGLGLFNTRKILELHRGKIWVENEPDIYTEFIFTLPKKIKEGVI